MHFYTTRRVRLQTYKCLHKERKKKALISREVAEHKREPWDFLFKNLFPTPVPMAAPTQGSPYDSGKARSHSVYEMLHYSLYLHLYYSLNNYTWEDSFFCCLSSKLSFLLSCITSEWHLLGSSKSLNQKAPFRNLRLKCDSKAFQASVHQQTNKQTKAAKSPTGWWEKCDSDRHRGGCGELRRVSPNPEHPKAKPTSALPPSQEPISRSLFHFLPWSSSESQSSSDLSFWPEHL